MGCPDIKKILKILNKTLQKYGFAERAVLEENTHKYIEFGYKNVKNKKLIIQHKAEPDIITEIVFFSREVHNGLTHKNFILNSASLMCLKGGGLYVGKPVYRGVIINFENDKNPDTQHMYEAVAAFLQGKVRRLNTKRTIDELFEEVQKNPNPYLLKDIEYPSDYPVFKFCPNPLKTQSVIEGSAPCECCGKSKKHTYIAGIDHYAEEEIDEVSNLCLDCIANGDAIKKFGGAFTDKSFIANRTTDKAITEEIMYRTPSFQTWQEKEWLSHCKTPCAYIGQVYIGDLLKMDIYKQVRTDLAKTFYYKNMPLTVSEIDDMLIEMVEGSSLCGHLFQCVICGKYRLHTDLD